MDLAILLSGRGSNFEAIHQAIVDRKLDATIVCVISNRPDARGIERARELGLSAHVFDHKKYPTRAAHEEDVLRVLAEIANTRKIAAVIVRGKYLSRADLDRLLEQARAAANSQL